MVAPRYAQCRHLCAYRHTTRKQICSQLCWPTRRPLVQASSQSYELTPALRSHSVQGVRTSLCLTAFLTKQLFCGSMTAMQFACSWRRVLVVDYKHQAMSPDVLMFVVKGREKKQHQTKQHALAGIYINMLIYLYVRCNLGIKNACCLLKHFIRSTFSISMKTKKLISEI